MNPLGGYRCNSLGDRSENLITSTERITKDSILRLSTSVSLSPPTSFCHVFGGYNFYYSYQMLLKVLCNSRFPTLVTSTSLTLKTTGHHRFQMWCPSASMGTAALLRPHLTWHSSENMITLEESHVGIFNLPMNFNLQWHWDSSISFNTHDLLWRLNIRLV